MNILIISPEPWDTNQVSKHHYARTLARRGHKVFFLDPPDESTSRVSIESITGEEGDIQHVRGPRIAPGLRLMPAALRRRLERRWLEGLERRVNASIDIVWLFENSRFFDMTFAGERLKIYHQVDVDQNLHVAQAALSADISFAVSDVVLRRVAPYAKSAHKISHGVLTMKAPPASEPSSFMRPGRLAAAYIGNLDAGYLDLDLFADVVCRSPDVDFHMLGGSAHDGVFHRRFGGMPNVIFWGRLPSIELAAALAGMDALMLVYDTKAYREERANPHKLMEYLASGKVTIATWTEEYKSLAGGPVVMVEDPGDYPAAFRAVMADLGRWNAPELQAQRIAFARDNTYDRQLDRITLAINDCSAIRDRFGEIRL